MSTMGLKKRQLTISLGLFALALFLLAAMVSYSPYDIAFETSTPNLHIRNYTGVAGAYIAWIIFKSVGYAGFLMPFLCIVWGIGIMAGRWEQKRIVRFLGLVLLFCSTASLFSLTGEKDAVLIVERGGLIGLFLSNFLTEYFGTIGGYIISITLSILTLLVTTEFLVIPLVSFLFVQIWNFISKLAKRKLPVRGKDVQEKFRPGPRLRPGVRPEPKLSAEHKRETPKVIRPPEARPVPPKITISKEKPLPKPKPVAKKPARSTPRIVGDYNMPSLDLLDTPPVESQRILSEDLEANARILEETLHDFDIEAKVIEITKGPVITRYELQPAPGVKVTRITALMDDIALTMKAPTVRIVAPIPGKSAIGIEIPNQTTSLVYLRELLASREYQQKASGSKLVIALGKDISGRCVVADLGEMPHLLIAGTTGSGKTVCVNSLIMSMIYNATPDELKFLMIDPKMVELAIYNGIPHLLCPVVTEPKKAAAALGWVVNEMEERYKLLAKSASRNIEAFNKKTDDKLPYIVVIIDELADLMMVVPQDVEDAITRLAQLSRAVGVHLILATQRPSVDVVTGVIKANFPARISFKVASKVDSRTVLDMNGADKLLGKGDMLFLEPGNPKPIRAQGTLLTDPEIEKVVNMIKAQREPAYEHEILESQKKSLADRASFEKDEFFDEAVRMVLETGQASVSMLQRRLRLGYTRAARLIDAMEAEGIVGPFRGSKPREILITEYKSKKESQEDVS